MPRLWQAFPCTLWYEAPPADTHARASQCQQHSGNTCLYCCYTSGHPVTFSSTPCSGWLFSLCYCSYYWSTCFFTEKYLDVLRRLVFTFWYCIVINHLFPIYLFSPFLLSHYCLQIVSGAVSQGSSTPQLIVADQVTGPDQPIRIMVSGLNAQHVATAVHPPPAHRQPQVCACSAVICFQKWFFRLICMAIDSVKELWNSSWYIFFSNNAWAFLSLQTFIE